MGKGGGSSEKVIVTAGSGKMFGSKKGKAHVGIDCTPTGTFTITIGLIVSTLVLHLVGRIISK